MDIEASKNYNNLEKSYENFIEAEYDDKLIQEEKSTQEDYITDEYDNVIIRDLDIDNNEENYTDVDGVKGKSEEVISEKSDLENLGEDKSYSSEEDHSRVTNEGKKVAYDEGYKNGYEKGARDAMKAAFRAGFRYGIRRSRYSK